MSRRIPRQGEFYKHFKNKLYQIVAIAIDSENAEQLVVYQALYGSFKIYARSLKMFMSEVDHKKYPNVTQKYRFELFEPNKVIIDEQKESNDENFYEEEKKKEESQNEFHGSKEQNEKVKVTIFDFLDAKTYEEKRDIFMAMKKGLNEKLLHDIAASLDIVVEETEFDKQYQSILNCLNTMVKFECNRFR